jgi:hypothetical protein
MTSLENGAFSFIEYLLSNEAGLKVVHPRLREAYEFYKNGKVK